VLSVSGSQIVILTNQAPLPTTCPANGLISADSVTVVNINTGNSATANLGFNFQLPLPVITGINPTSGGIGSNVTIQGRDFSPQNVGVTFGTGNNGSSAHVVSSSAGAITVVVPTPPQGFTFNTQPCGTNGSGTQNVATPITIMVRDLSTGCSTTFTNGFLLAPADTTCNGQTVPPPPTAPTASFTATPVNGHVIQFADTSTATGTATITGWSWNFGDPASGVNNTSTLQNPAHDYTPSGGPFPRNFSVTLRVTDSNGLTNQTVKVTTVP
jgi:PKD repeat protein